MTKKTIIRASIFSLILFKVFTKDAFAIDIPNFPSCNNPHEYVRVYNATGNHGIVGSNSTYSGSDTVYDIGNSNHYQCYCSDSGQQGIQTNWWKISSLDQNQINQLLGLGWHYVADGSAWGLESGNYLAINSNYSCRGGEVLGISKSMGEVLGLAYTGGTSQILSLFGLSGLFAVTAFFFKKRAA